MRDDDRGGETNLCLIEKLDRDADCGRHDGGCGNEWGRARL